MKQRFVDLAGDIRQPMNQSLWHGSGQASSSTASLPSPFSPISEWENLRTIAALFEEIGGDEFLDPTGVPRIRAELALLGHEVSRSTVWKYIDRSNRLPSPTWRSFLKNHAAAIAAIDFFTVPTATFRVLFCFIVLEHSRRRILHFNVTTNPSAEWTGIQVVQAFPYDTAPKYLLRDNDRIYGEAFRGKVESLEMREVKISPHSPWQTPYVERPIGSVRRECLDHMVVLGERHLRRILSEYVGYYNESRAHQSLEGNSPVPRQVEPPEQGAVIAIPFLGGLHHRYARAA